MRLRSLLKSHISGWFNQAANDFFVIFCADGMLRFGLHELCTDIVNHR